MAFYRQTICDLIEACEGIGDDPAKDPAAYAAVYWARAVLNPERYANDHPAVAERLKILSQPAPVAADGAGPRFQNGETAAQLVARVAADAARDAAPEDSAALRTYLLDALHPLVRRIDGAADGAGRGERRWLCLYRPTPHHPWHAGIDTFGTESEARGHYTVPINTDCQRVVSVLADDAGAAGAAETHPPATADDCDAALAAAEGEAARLRDAIKRAGFAVMQTSGAWDIYDVSDQGKAADAKSLEVATENAELSVENRRLRTALEWYADPMTYEESVPVRGKICTGDVPIESDNGERARAALAAPAGGAAGRDGTKEQPT